MSLEFLSPLAAVAIPSLVEGTLPGLWVALLYGLLLLILRRLQEPIHPLATGIFAATVVALFAPALFAGQILLPLDNLRGTPPFQLLAPTEPHGNVLQGDLIQLIEPARRGVADALSAGRWPLVLEQGGGVALLADPQAQAFQPLTLLVAPLPAAAAPGALAALKILLALTFTFRLFRRLGATAGSACFGALAYGAGAFMVLWVGWPLSTTAAWLPALLWAVHRWFSPLGPGEELETQAFARSGEEVGVGPGMGAEVISGIQKPAKSGPVAIIWFALLTAGHPETIIYAIAVVMAWAWVLNSSFKVWRQQRLVRRRVLALGLLLTLVTGLAAPIWLPTLLHLPTTRRAAEAKSAEPPAAADRLQRLLPAIAIQALGNDRYLGYWGPGNHNEDAGAFVGTATLLLAAFGLLYLRRRNRQHGSSPESAGLLYAGFFATTLVVALIIQLRPPPVSWIVDALPGFSAFRGSAHQRLSMIVALALAALAVHGLEHLRSRSSNRRHSQVSRAAFVGLGHQLRQPWRLQILALAAILAAGLVAIYQLARHPTEPETLEILRWGWLHWQGRFLLVSSAILFLWARQRSAPWIVCGLLAMELVLALGPANPSMPSRLFFPTTPALEFLQANMAEGDRLAGDGENLVPNLGALYGLADVRVYNPVEGAGWARALAPLRIDDGENVPRFGAPEDPRWDLAGARWWLTAPQQELDLPLVYGGPDARVYRRPSALPWLRVEAAADMEDHQLAVRVEQIDRKSPARVDVLLEPPVKRPRTDPQDLSPGASKFIETARGALTAVVDNTGSAWHWLHHTEAGARRLAPLAIDDSASEPIATLPQLRVSAPEGPARLTLLYRPRGLLLGALLGALALAALLGLAMPLRPRAPAPRGSHGKA
ncbi:MAG: hypothetical protein AAGD01_01870 [Acidobacteriota bacterium]